MAQLLGPAHMHRPHGSLNGKTPIDRQCELSKKLPFSWEVWDVYDETKEFRFGGRPQVYTSDQKMQKLK